MRANPTILAIRGLEPPAVAWIVDPDVARAHALAQALSPDLVAVVHSAQPPLDLEGDAPDVLLCAITGAAGCGLELCRDLRTNEATATLPIVLVGSREVDHRAAAFAAGASDLVEHPLMPEIVRARVGTLVAVRRQAALLQRIGTLDPCTGTRNARAFDDALERAWRAALRVGQPLGLLLVRPDTASVPRLVAVSEALGDVARRPHDVIGRVRADTLGVLLPDTAGHGAVQVADRARGVLVGRRAAGATGRVAVGVAACFPSIRERPAELVARAEAALERALDEGGDLTWLDPDDPTIRPALRPFGSTG